MLQLNAFLRQKKLRLPSLVSGRFLGSKELFSWGGFLLFFYAASDTKRCLTYFKDNEKDADGDFCLVLAIRKLDLVSARCFCACV